MKLKWSSFCCAFTGIAWMFRTQQHARWHLLSSIAVIVLAFALSISRLEWLAILLAMSLVWTAEALNTAIEMTCDAITKEWLPQIGKAKDVAAGAVLIASLFAILIGSIVLLPKLWPE